MTDQKDQRPSCGYKVERKNEKGEPVRENCGSEDRLFTVKGKGKYSGAPRATRVCAKHRPNVWKEWEVEEAVPYVPTSHK
jgi:hypothetical protein